jgi:hypothetical protein
LAEVTLEPEQYVTVEYTLPKKTFVDLELESDLPVKSYIVGPVALRRYREGSTTFKYWGGFPDPRRHQQQKVWIPFSGAVFLLIMNPSKRDPADVEFELSF